MEHIAVDLGGRESQVCIRRADGGVVHEQRVKTGELRGLFLSRTPSRVILESCSEALAVAEFARGAGHDVRVVPASLVRTLGVGARRLKSDRRDAQVLSEVSSRIELPSIYLKRPKARDWLLLLGLRDGLVHARTLLINTVRGWLRTQLVRVAKGYSPGFPKRVREKLLAVPTGMPVSIERQLSAIEDLTRQISLANKDICLLARQDPVCQLLMTAPGVGPMVAVRYVATIDDVARFSDVHRLVSYLGLTPSESSSSETQRRGGITKAGSPGLRWLMIQAAWALWRTRPGDALVVWAKKVAERRGRFVAVVGLARRLAGILYAMWRDNRPFIPSSISPEALTEST